MVHHKGPKDVETIPSPRDITNFAFPFTANPSNIE